MRHGSHTSFIEEACTEVVEDLGDEIVNEGKGLTGSMYMLGKAIVEAAQQDYKLAGSTAEKAKQDKLETRRDYDKLANNRVKLEKLICLELTSSCSSPDAWLPETTTQIHREDEDTTQPPQKGEAGEGRRDKKKAKVVLTETEL